MALKTAILTCTVETKVEYDDTEVYLQDLKDDFENALIGEPNGWPFDVKILSSNATRSP